LSAVTEIPEVASAGAAVLRELRSGDLVLLKASRSTRLERVGEVIRGGMTAAAGSNPPGAQLN